MATQGVTDWKKEWFEIEDATYLNTAAHTVMPRVSIRAVERSLEAKKFPHRVDDSLWFESPVRIRGSLARMIGAKPEEIAVTTGASTGAAAVAHGLEWRPGDEIITTQGEFPLHYSTWKPMEKREGVRLRTIAPRDRFITADDLIDALTPRTRIVSVSLVRYDDGTLLDAARVSAACHAQGTLLLLDVSQACGAVPMSVKDLGADFIVCAGYKWLLSCYGTGFFWIKNEHLDTLRPGPFYWTGQNTDNFSELNFVDFKPSRTPNAGTPQNGQRTTTSISPRWRSRWTSCCVPARNMSPRTIAVLSNLCIVISQRIVVLPQVRWSLEDAGRLDASQRANQKELSSFTRSCGEKTLS